MDIKIKNKKGQITIFVIIAIVIIALVVLFFSLSREPETSVGEELDPYIFVEKCIKDYTDEAIDIMLPQGGYLEPSLFKLYDDKKVSYLCYNKNFYETCINQQPMYINFLKQQILEYVEPRAEVCFDSLIRELEKRNYNVDSEQGKYSVQILPDKVKIIVEKKTEIKKQETRKFDFFEASLNSPLYGLQNIAIEIANQESRFCAFEYIGFSLLYPEYKIDKTLTGGSVDSAKIYIIRHKKTNKELYFAIRSCAMPATF